MHLYVQRQGVSPDAALLLTASAPAAGQLGTGVPCKSIMEHASPGIFQAHSHHESGSPCCQDNQG